MPPVFYSEVIERQIDAVEGRPVGKERKVITRYYTEFKPDPQTVLDRLFADDGDSLPPIFYEIENFNAAPYKKLPAAVGIKPISINIEPGNWGDRLDWTAQWEELEDQQPPLNILGITLYSWSKTKTEKVEVVEYPFGHKIFNTSSNFAGEFTPKRIAKPTYTYSGKYIGDLNERYSMIRNTIDENTSVVGFTVRYNPVTNISDVTIQMEEDESEDDSRA